MKKPSYAEAIAWIATNTPDGIAYWATTALVSDLFGVIDSQVRREATIAIEGLKTKKT